MDEWQKLLGLLALFGSAFGVCLVTTPLVRRRARQWGLVDHPDGRRKIHRSPIPVAGGVAIFLSSIVCLAGAWWMLPLWRESGSDRGQMLVALFVACLVIVLVGVIDDSRGLRG